MKWSRERASFRCQNRTWLEELRASIRGTLIRYDDAHGRFHRHAPGWPEPGPIVELLDGVAARSRAAYAMAEIRERYHLWEAGLFGQEGGRADVTS